MNRKILHSLKKCPNLIPIHIFSHKITETLWVGKFWDFYKSLSFLSMFSWMNEPEPVTVPFCLKLWWWGVKEGRRADKAIFFPQKIYNRGICFYISAIHLVLSLCYVTTLGLLGRGLPQQIWCCPDPSLLIITSMNIKQLFICTVYMHTTTTSHLHECHKTPILRPGSDHEYQSFSSCSPSFSSYLYNLREF